jgi:nicotinate-nucleotide adenylyltransferase
MLNDLCGKDRGLSEGGIGAMHLPAWRVGLIRRTADELCATGGLKRHLPYHESDRVLSIAYNILSGGTCVDPPSAESSQGARSNSVHYGAGHTARRYNTVRASWNHGEKRRLSRQSLSTLRDWAYTSGMDTRIGLYGGSFDPIHNGHLIIARAVAERLGLERVILLPSANPPHKPGERLAELAHRAQMVKLAIADEPLFEFSDYDLTRTGPSYTIDTVNHFRGLLGPQADLHWIIGADSLAELTTWHRAAELVDACRIVTAARTGWEQIAWDELAAALDETQIAKLKTGVLDTPVVEISSTDIRRRIRQGLSVRYLLAEKVLEYIERHGLYREA